MRAFAIDHPGERGSLRDLPVPALDAASVLVRVAVAGANPVDWKNREGRYGGGGASPRILGQDFAGIVERAGDGVTDLRTGDRVFGIARTHGGYAEYTVVPTDARGEPVATIPQNLSDEHAAALPTPGLTALAALELLGAGAQTTLVILGAAGAVGGFATQMARARGAHVTGTVNGDPDVARSLGAEDVFDAKDGDVYAAIRTRHPDGVDAVLDLVSSDGEAIKGAARIVRDGGKLVSTNHAADEAWFASKGIQATNIVMNQTPQSSRAGLERIARMAVDGTITVRVAAVRPLADAADVLDGMKNHTLDGKIVLAVSGR